MIVLTILRVKSNSLVENHERGLVNGSRGVVIGFDETRQMYPRVRVSDEVIGSDPQQINIVQFVNGSEVTIEPHRWAIEIEGREVAVSVIGSYVMMSLTTRSLAFKYR